MGLIKTCDPHLPLTVWSQLKHKSKTWLQSKCPVGDSLETQLLISCIFINSQWEPRGANLFWICNADAKSCYATVSESILAINPTYCPTYSACLQLVNDSRHEKLVGGVASVLSTADTLPATYAAVMSLPLPWTTCRGKPRTLRV